MGVFPERKRDVERSGVFIGEYRKSTGQEALTPTVRGRRKGPADGRTGNAKEEKLGMVVQGYYNIWEPKAQGTP